MTSIELHYLDGRKATIEVEEDKKKEGWENVWARSIINRAGKDGFFETSENVFVPMHRIAWFQIITT